MGNYDDIIKLKRPISRHPHMTLEQRSAQFAPFAALTGYDGQIKEKSRYVDTKIELDEEAKNILDLKINMLRMNMSADIQVKITYFVKDKLKNGGMYETIPGTIEKIDLLNEQICLNNGLNIEINDIIEIDSDVF